MHSSQSYSNSGQRYESYSGRRHSTDLPVVYRKQDAPRSSYQRSMSTSDAIYKFTLKEPYLSQILDGKKTIEGRIDTGAFKKIRVGEKIIFYNGNREAHCKITEKTSYISFRAMLEKEGIENCLPSVRSIDQGVQIYNNIPGYAEKARKFGVIALQISIDRDRAAESAPAKPIVERKKVENSIEDKKTDNPRKRPREINTKEPQQKRSKTQKEEP